MTEQEPVELIRVDEGEEGESASIRKGGGDPDRMHTWLRTVAVVVGAGSLLWMGVSAAGERDLNERQWCIREIESVMYTGLGPPERSDEVGEELVARAEDCGLGVYVEMLRREYDLE